MPKRQDLEFISETLASAVERLGVQGTYQDRLENGFRLRAMIHESLKNGVHPDHYRMRWLSDSVDEVVGFLRDVAKRFDEAHPEDMASVMDLIDVLQSTILTMRASFEKKEG